MQDQTYITWQNRLAARKWYRRFWQGVGLRGILIYFLLSIIFIFQPYGWKIVFLAGLAGFITRYVICELFVLAYKKPHPYQRLDFKVPTWWLFSMPDGRYDAFPSQHSATTMAIAAVFYLFDPVLGIVAMLAAAVIGLARIVIGYHDFSDVIAGLFIGAISGLALGHWLPFIFFR
jgi:membrane-associated phospholipid phosphatase